jgi:hypothetical protein
VGVYYLDKHVHFLAAGNYLKSNRKILADFFLSIFAARTREAIAIISIRYASNYQKIQ